MSDADLTGNASASRATFTEEDLQKLIGRELPGGSFTVPPHRQWLLNDVVCGQPGPFPKDGSLAHPLFAYLSTGAMGVTWDELFAICGSNATDGPMFGEHETVLDDQFRVGETYKVSGRFVTAERKQGRRTGVFDIIGFTLDIHNAVGERIAQSTSSIVYPRRDEAK